MTSQERPQRRVKTTCQNGQFSRLLLVLLWKVQKIKCVERNSGIITILVRWILLLTPTPSLCTAAVHRTFMSFFRPFSMTKSSRDKIVIPLSYIFTAFIFLKISSFTWLDWEKNLFSLAVLRISPKNRIKAAWKIWNDGESLWNLYVMLNKLFRIY